MKEKVIEVLNRWDNYILGGDINNALAEAIDTLYRREIDKLKEIIQAQDELIKVERYKKRK